MKSMTRYMIPMLLLILSFGCQSTEEGQNNTAESHLAAEEILNVQYGEKSEQKMDIYLPEGRNSNTKVFILVHGGGWTGGSKADTAYVIPMLKQQFPGYAIVNIDYRLASIQYPAFPKQVQDIEEAIQFLKRSNYKISNNYALIGASAGAHIAMLYSYRFDTHGDIKAVCSIVGPSDFTDPNYKNHPYFHYGAQYLIGNINYREHPEVVETVSPAMQVKTTSPPTIMFYGGQGPLLYLLHRGAG
ncbi:alpha/beta hydrolase [Flavobacterium sp. J372]|uniref:alpha/beta hydrolase n=1 Tax=Flavobacterium sp. J372 TaxID=2898436 RepID=UPI0021509719|nr:alpha/beta hydrolase [Flavobacterium sp. J372]MCR5862708.1 alpha/beta hydrolase [Flavobacterium sp. J372]